MPWRGGEARLVPPGLSFWALRRRMFLILPPGSVIRCDPVHARFRPVQAGSGPFHDEVGRAEARFYVGIRTIAAYGPPGSAATEYPLYNIKGDYGSRASYFSVP
jgi:hypothetical protein